MQSTYSARQKAQAISLSDGAIFGTLAFALVLASAALASLAPIAFSIAIVFLFAGPHNWMELRYFLSRLPSRFGPLRKFFTVSFSGVLVLGLSYVAITYLSRMQLIHGDTVMLVFKIWIAAFYAWLGGLLLTRREKLGPVRALALALVFTVASLSLVWPVFFTFALVYLHPLVGLWILDRELRRTRRSWSVPYRACLAIVPLVLAAMIFQLAGTDSLPVGSLLDWQITNHAGATFFKNISSHLLVSAHTFLEMLHYGVWVFAIPIAGSAWSKWKLNVMPVSRNSLTLKKLLPIALVGSTLAVLGLSVAFLGDYSMTRDVYFTVAVFHILAELPFLLWIL